MNTSERLKAYDVFDEAVISRVSEIAEWQNKFSFQELAAQHQINSTEVVLPPDENKYIEFLRIDPTGDYDESKRRAYHAPMSIPADENMAMRAIRLFAVMPDIPLVVIGNPAAVGIHTNKININKLKPIWDGDLTPAVKPLLKHFKQEGVTTTTELGYSYGADKAATAAAEAESYGITVDKGVFIEPVAVAERGLFNLLKDFKRSEAPLEAYVAASNSQALIEARQQADTGFTRYVGGLARLSNIAIANALAHPLFEERVARALRKHTDMQATIGWGSESEITPNLETEKIVCNLNQSFGKNRVMPFRIPGMHHAGGDDIDLHAAIILQSLQND